VKLLPPSHSFPLTSLTFPLHRLSLLSSHHSLLPSPGRKSSCLAARPHPPHSPRSYDPPSSAPPTRGKRRKRNRGKEKSNEQGGSRKGSQEENREGASQFVEEVRQNGHLLLQVGLPGTDLEGNQIGGIAGLHRVALHKLPMVEHSLWEGIATGRLT